KELDPKKRAALEAAEKALNRFEEAEGLTIKFDQYGVTFTVDVVKSQLDLAANVTREVTSTLLRPTRLTYHFDSPVEYEGNLVSEITLRPSSIEACRAGGARSTAECLVQSLQLPASVRIPEDSTAAKVTVTPSVEVAVDVTQTFRTNPSLSLSVEAGRFRDISIGPASGLGWPAWTSCAGIPYPAICQVDCKEKCTDWLRCGPFQFACDEICRATQIVCDHIPCVKFWYPSIPAFPLPDLSIPNINPLPTIHIPMPDLEAVLLERTDTLIATLQLDPFGITISRPIFNVGISADPSVTSACGYDGQDNAGFREDRYAQPGDTVSVRFSAKASEAQDIEVRMNGRLAVEGPVTVQVDGAGAVHSCTYTHVLDALDPNGEVAFSIAYTEPGRSMRQRVEGTSDNSHIWYLASAPTAPTDPVIELTSHYEGGASPTIHLSWKPAHDSLGRPAETYEIKGQVTNLYDGQLVDTFSYPVQFPCLATSEQMDVMKFQLPAEFTDTLPPNCSVAFQVRGSDPRVQWGPYTATAWDCYLLPPEITMVHIQSNNTVRSDYATEGDKVIVTFETALPVPITPEVTINSKAATVTGSGTTWTASRLIDADECLNDRILYTYDLEIRCENAYPACDPGKALVTTTYGTTDGSSMVLLGFPESPSLWRPLDETPLDVADGSVRLSWYPRSDGAYSWYEGDWPPIYELEYRVTYPSGYRKTTKVETRDDNYDLELAGLEDASVEWHVRMQDPVGRWSKYSAWRTLYIVKGLAVTITFVE
ncbi:hypothetical protein IH601_09945, partial [Candidatus Bipolaricaulota bacterium]|nr:hypothetical protein [Candidatus Bipolaricaulota bacterium]